MQASGLDDTPDSTRIARVIPQHCTLVAVQDSEITGFIDAFATSAPDGVIRWEIDLLGVHPAWQGRGIARQLVSDAVVEGTHFGAEQTRALVRCSNLAPRRTFAWCDFEPDRIPFDLYVGTPQGGQAHSLPTGMHLIPVDMLTYTGIWIEGVFSLAAFQFARVILQRYGWSSAGVLIPGDAPEMIHLAERAGYAPVGEFDWWIRA
jgi:GNAT superfamily N-acetyltransferase